MAQWWIGLSTAECAWCGTALPLRRSGLHGAELGHLYWERDVLRHGWHYGGTPHHGTAYDAAEWPPGDD